MARQTGRGPILGIISNTQVQVNLSKQQNPFKSSEFIILALGLDFRLPSPVESAKFKVLRPIFFSNYQKFKLYGGRYEDILPLKMVSFRGFFLLINISYWSVKETSQGNVFLRTQNVCYIDNH